MYLQFLQFIKQVKDENGAITDDDLAQNWSEEYLDATNEMERTFNKTWKSEQATTSGMKFSCSEQHKIGCLLSNLYI